ncbi:MAG: RnfABCDGE type electron transport complex subunit C [Anaerococcus hydrogenalis]|nr:RnfABCDGE type electron transport complex subunit C [Anaerococcus hydrogenalis]
MALENLSFDNGVKIPEYKELSENSDLIVAKVPKTVTIPLTQHIGAPSKCLVKKNDEVKVGELIGEAVGNFSCNIHSSVSGIVTNVIDIQTASGKNAKAVVIDTEGYDQEINYERKDVTNLTKEKIVEAMKENGLVGMGGAAFPACDDYLLKTKAEIIVDSLELLVKAVDAKKGIIAIEDNKQEAIEKVRKAITDKNSPKLELATMVTKYPQGDEKRIINAVLHREVPSGGLPMDVGVIVSNVSSANAVYEAVYYGKPLIERYMTVTGHGIKNPSNFLVRLGTSFDHMIEEAGGMTEDAGKVINGGPMMGIAQPNINQPVEKASNCILVLNKEESKAPVTNPCIRCAKCVNVCPVGLMPLLIHKFSLKEKFDKAQDLHILDCIECGSCSYICPSKRPLVEAIRFGKRQIRQAGK